MKNDREDHEKVSRLFMFLNEKLRKINLILQKNSIELFILDR